ncbi:zinc ribbon domain-containing protein [Pilimelia columellifera]|uniref:C4-type zinc ribbon domain-containing protein n=1 Tax=Pilimelia columellifera subsp. columellifera TaxID=706583 RepID=A0ABP6ARC6_9ACTN
MKAAPAAQLRLLDLQTVDTALAQLAHRRRSLPEIAELDALARELSKLEDERVRAQVAVDDLDRDIARLESDTDQVRARKRKDEDRLVGGGLPARELTALQHEVESLTRRQGELEDAELALMEQREQAQANLDGVTERLSATRANRDEAQRRHDETLAGISRDEEFHRTARQAVVADLPGDLVSLYLKVQDSAGVMAAALVQGGRCGGCRIEFSGSERARLKAAAADEITRCEDCRRIMVRTSESGL